MSLLGYLGSELTRGYKMDGDEERYNSKRQKMYTFMKIPRELEKFMSYGFFHCLDSFLFVFTFLPVRCLRAVGAAIIRWRLEPAEAIDLLKGLIIVACVVATSAIDTSVMYHVIKSQSVIKLYLFFNMLEVGDRLFSAFGQDTIDALFWTATESRLERKRDKMTVGVVPHFFLAAGYVFLHTMLVMLQATTLNVAINASNKALLTIMMSNNFVELKGSVFKKFDKSNLFQVSCSDVRERFHLFSLLFIVVVQTMKEYGWREEAFWALAPDCLLVYGAEFFVDWIKHAFITRFNEVTAEVYKDYTISLAYDLAQTKQTRAFSDHSDLVSRRMGFIPLPLGVVMIRVVGSAVRLDSVGAFVVLVLAYLCLVTFRVLGSIVILGKACDLIDLHRASTSSSSGVTSPAPADKKEPTVDSEIDDDAEVSVFECGPPANLGGDRIEAILVEGDHKEQEHLPDLVKKPPSSPTNSAKDLDDDIEYAKEATSSISTPSNSKREEKLTKTSASSTSSLASFPIVRSLSSPDLGSDPEVMIADEEMDGGISVEEMLTNRVLSDDPSYVSRQRIASETAVDQQHVSSSSDQQKTLIPSSVGDLRRRVFSGGDSYHGKK